MFPRVTEAKYIAGYILHLKFQDGTEGDLNLESELYGEIFEPLKSPSFFQKFVLHPELHTVTWPNGADFAPEFLYEKVRVLHQSAA